MTYRPKSADVIMDNLKGFIYNLICRDISPKDAQTAIPGMEVLFEEKEIEVPNMEFFPANLTNVQKDQSPGNGLYDYFLVAATIQVKLNNRETSILGIAAPRALVMNGIMKCFQPLIDDNEPKVEALLWMQQALQTGLLPEGAKSSEISKVLRNWKTKEAKEESPYNADARSSCIIGFVDQNNQYFHIPPQTAGTLPWKQAHFATCHGSYKIITEKSYHPSATSFYEFNKRMGDLEIRLNNGDAYENKKIEVTGLEQVKKNLEAAKEIKKQTEKKVAEAPEEVAVESGSGDIPLF